MKNFSVFNSLDDDPEDHKSRVKSRKRRSQVFKRKTLRLRIRKRILSISQIKHGLFRNGYKYPKRKLIAETNKVRKKLFRFLKRTKGEKNGDT